MKRYHSFEKFSEGLESEYNLTEPKPDLPVEFKDYSGRVWKLAIVAWPVLSEHRYFYVFVNTDDPDQFIESIYISRRPGSIYYKYDIRRFSESSIKFVKFYDE